MNKLLILFIIYSISVAMKLFTISVREYPYTRVVTLSEDVSQIIIDIIITFCCAIVLWL